MSLRVKNLEDLVARAKAVLEQQEELTDEARHLLSRIACHEAMYDTEFKVK